MLGKEIQHYKLNDGENKFLILTKGIKSGVYSGQLIQDGAITESIKLIHVR